MKTTAGDRYRAQVLVNGTRVWRGKGTDNSIAKHVDFLRRSYEMAGQDATIEVRKDWD